MVAQLDLDLITRPVRCTEAGQLELDVPPRPVAQSILVEQLPKRCCSRRVHRGHGLIADEIRDYASCDVCLAHYYEAAPVWACAGLTDVRRKSSSKPFKGAKSYQLGRDRVLAAVGTGATFAEVMAAYPGARWDDVFRDLLRGRRDGLLVAAGDDAWGRGSAHP